MAYITAAELRDYIGASSHTDDTQLGYAATRAQSMVDAYCNRTFEAAADRTTKFNKEELEKAEKIQKELLDRSVYYTNQRIKAVETEADASIRANRGNYPTNT